MNIGSRIRKARMLQHRTLQDVAQECGFTRSLLSKIENGRTTPPVATLTRIARALSTTVGSFLDEQRFETCSLIRSSDINAESLVTTRTGYSFFAFAGHRSGKMMQPYLFIARKGKIKAESLAHAGEEFVYVLEGEMSYRVGATTYALKPGDSLYFDSSEPHSLSPISAQVRYLAVFVEPDFTDNRNDTSPRMLPRGSAQATRTTRK